MASSANSLSFDVSVNGFDLEAPVDTEWWTPETLTASQVHAQNTGTTLWLAPGDYPAINLDSIGTKVLTLRSVYKNGSKRARFADTSQVLSVSGLSGGLTLKNVRVQRLATGTENGSTSVIFLSDDAANITFDGCDLMGDVGQNPSSSQFGVGSFDAVNTNGASNVTIKNCLVKTCRQGISTSGGTNWTITNTEITEPSNDFIKVAATQDLEVSFNYIHLLKKAEDAGHPDAMQMFQTSVEPSQQTRNVVIFGNRIETGGDLPFFQQIFMTANYAVDNSRSDLLNENILVAHNYIFATHLHGITAEGCKNTWIENNTVLHDPRGTSNSFPDGGANTTTFIPRINVYSGSTAVTVTDNVTASVVDQVADTTETGTITAQRQDAQAADYYGNLFLDFEANTLAGFAAVPGGSIYTAGAGSYWTRPNDPVATIPTTLPWET